MNMLENKKFTMHKAPFIRKADHGENTTVMMRDFMIALAPLIIFAWVKNGLLPYIADKTNFFGMLYPLLLVLVGAASAFLFEFLWYYFIIKKEKVWISLAKSYPLIPGILLGMIVPVSTPLWLVVIGVFFATVVGKLLFGGFGNNIFNPALLGYLFLTFAYFGVMTGNNAAIGANSYFNAKEVADAVSSATPMTVFMGDRVGSVNLLIEKYGLLKMFLGFTPGALAETSALLCLLAFIFLTIRKTIDWRIPTIYVGSVFVLTYIIGAINGYAGTLNYALFGVLNGGLMFGAVFMATEPVTSPRNPNGVILYSFGLGALTVLFRFASSMPEGVATSILIMNMFTAALERFSAKLRVEPNKRKVVVSYALIGLLFAGIGTLAVVKNMPKHVEAPEIEFVETEQDFSTFNFKYKFLIGEEEVVVETDKSYKILNINNPDYRTDEYKTAFSELISKNKYKIYVDEAFETAVELRLTVITRGFSANLTVEITFNNDFEMTAFETDTRGESYENYEGWNGVHPDEATPPLIIENQDDLSKVDVKTGATVTNEALVNAARYAFKYIEYLQNITELKLVGNYQNYDNLNFVYVLRDADGKYLVEADKDGNLLSDVDEGVRAEIEALVSNNKPEEFIASKEGNSITVRTKAYGANPPLLTNVTYDPETLEITAFEADTSSETYGSPDNEEKWNGVHPDEALPNQILENQDDLDKVEAVTGATVTSNSLIRAARIALDYLAYLGGKNE